MKLLLLLLSFSILVCNPSTAQNPTDFYVSFSKSATNDTLHVYVSVQKHQNISYETLDVEIREKNAAQTQRHQISSRFPYGVINDMNVYIYHIPMQIRNGAIYEIVLDNKKLCNVGPYKLEDVFSSDTIRTFSYANPGYRLVQSVKMYINQ